MATQLPLFTSWQSRMTPRNPWEILSSGSASQASSSLHSVDVLFRQGFVEQLDVVGTNSRLVTPLRQVEGHDGPCTAVYRGGQHVPVVWV